MCPCKAGFLGMHFDRVEWVRVPAPTTAKRSRRPADDEGYDPSKSIHFMEINEKSWISMISQLEGFLGSLGNISSTTPSYAQASCATFEVPAQARGRRGHAYPPTPEDDVPYMAPSSWEIQQHIARCAVFPPRNTRRRSQSRACATDVLRLKFQYGLF